MGMSTITKTCHEKLEKPERSFFLFSFFFKDKHALKAEPYLGSLGTHTAVGLGNAKANMNVAVMPLFCLILCQRCGLKQTPLGNTTQPKGSQSCDQKTLIKCCRGT